jgi:glyoxylase-like metal-dependent hydrolase (beta-lactamase superfamily II)
MRDAVMARATRGRAARRGTGLALSTAPALIAALLLSAASLQAQTASLARPTYEVYAVRYATLPQYRVAGLVAGADPARRLDLAMMVWLLRGSNGLNVLVDAGFSPRDDLMARWRPLDYVTPAEALARFGVRPEDVTDLIVSHIHWDHFDGVDLFPNARVWIQRDEIDHHVDADGGVLNRTIDAVDAAKLHAVRAAGRLMPVDGDAREIIPGITVHTGGKHTFQSQYARVAIEGGAVVIASDNAYLFENLEQRLAIAQTLDAGSNLAAQARMLTLASEPRLVIPGHDPEVFSRFEIVAPGVARIR